jgi:hypothetical protein
MEGESLLPLLHGKPPQGKGANQLSPAAERRVALGYGHPHEGKPHRGEPIPRLPERPIFLLFSF